MATNSRKTAVVLGSPGPAGPPGPQGPQGPAGIGEGLQSITLSNGVNHNVDTHDFTVVRASGPTAAFSIDGFKAPTTIGSGGQRFVLCTPLGESCTIKNRNAGSSSGNRVRCPGGVDITLVQGYAYAFIYDTTVSPNEWVLEHIGARMPFEINVRDFGAQGDGVTDDTAAIQAAFNSLTSAAPYGLYVGGAVVYFPAGTFIISSEIDIPVNVPCTIRGAGMNVTEVQQSTLGASGFASHYPFASGGGRAHLRISDMLISNPGMVSVATWQASHSYTVGNIVKAPGLSNRLLHCTTGGTSGAHTPFGQLWSGFPSNPSTNLFGNPTDPIVKITGNPASQYLGIVINIQTGGALGTATFQYSTDGGQTFTGSGTLTASTVTLGVTGLTANFASSGSYRSGANYCSPPFNCGFSVIVGDTIADGSGSLIWTVIDGGVGFLQEVGDSVHVHNCNFYGWRVGICYDGTEASDISHCTISCDVPIWLSSGNERQNSATAVSYVSATNCIRIHDINMDTNYAGIIDNGGVAHYISGVNLEGPTGAEGYSWVGWLAGVEQSEYKNITSEGFNSGFFVGSINAFSGSSNFPSPIVTFKNLEIGLGRSSTGPVFNGWPYPTGTPFNDMVIEQSLLDWVGAANGFINCRFGNGLRLIENSYTSATTFLDSAALSSVLWMQSSNATPGIGVNCTPQTSGFGGIDLGTLSSFAQRSYSLFGYIVTGTNNDTAFISNGIPLIGVYEISSGGGLAGAFTLTGLPAGKEGMRVRIVNVSAYAMTIAHENAGTTTAANRFHVSGGSDLTLSTGFSSVDLHYSTSQSRWLVVAHT